MSERTDTAPKRRGGRALVPGSYVGSGRELVVEAERVLDEGGSIRVHDFKLIRPHFTDEGFVVLADRNPLAATVRMLKLRKVRQSRSS